MAQYRDMLEEAKGHIQSIDSLIKDKAKSRLFLITRGVLKDLERLHRKMGVFEWVAKGTEKSKWNVGKSVVCMIPHFSSWHIHRSGEMQRIKREISSFLPDYHHH